MNYLSTWITPNEKHWFPQTFPNDNHSFCGNHNHYPSQHITSTSITNVPLKLLQSFKISLVGCLVHIQILHVYSTLLHVYNMMSQTQKKFHDVILYFQSVTQRYLKYTAIDAILPSCFSLPLWGDSTRSIHICTYFFFIYDNFFDYSVLSLSPDLNLCLLLLQPFPFHNIIWHRLNVGLKC